MSDNAQDGKRFPWPLRQTFRAASLAASAEPIYLATVAASADIVNAGLYFGTAGFISGSLIFHGFELARSTGATFMDRVQNAFDKNKLIKNFALAATIPAVLAVTAYAMGWDKPPEPYKTSFEIQS